MFLLEEGDAHVLSCEEAMASLHAESKLNL